MELKDYKENDTRKSDFKELKITSNNIKLVPFYYENELYNILEFEISSEIAQFAYNLACWKSPHIKDKINYPKRTEDEKLYHIILGCISEIMCYLYIKYLGIDDEDPRYYDIERESPEYNSLEEFDIKIKDRTMSVKVIPSIYNKEEKLFTYSDIVIKGTGKSSDRYYSQFLLSNGKQMNYISDLPVIKECIEKKEKLPISLYYLGGIVNKYDLVWEELLENNETVRCHHKKVIKFNKSTSLDNYIKLIFNDLNKNYGGLL